LLILACPGIGAYAADSVTRVEQGPELPASGPPTIADQDGNFPAWGGELDLVGW
jgi:hypothetical protein